MDRYAKSLQGQERAAGWFAAAAAFLTASVIAIVLSGCGRHAAPDASPELDAAVEVSP